MSAELEPFARFVEAIEPWLGELVLIGGWTHRLYRHDPRARKLRHAPLTTLDADVAIPPKLKIERSTVRKRLLDAGFKEEFVGDDLPPATHYYFRQSDGFYVEFLTPLTGSDTIGRGKRKATKEVSGVSSQRLRYIEILMISPWEIELGEKNGYPFKPLKRLQVANPTSFVAQKILIHHERNPRDRAKDTLYIHDTVEMFSDRLGELRETFEKEVRTQLHARRVRELSHAADKFFGNVNDCIRNAARMAVGRQLGAEALMETVRAGVGEIFGHANRLNSTPGSKANPRHK